MPIPRRSGPARPIHRSLRLAAMVVMAMTLVTMTVGLASAAGPNGNVTYNSVPDDLPGNVFSWGFQATSTSEFGDSVILEEGGRKAKWVEVVFSSWACESGAWFTHDCVTTPGATFIHPITVNLYTVAANGDPGALLVTSTEEMAIPYRPSADADCTLGRWYSESEEACYNGFATILKFKLDGNVRLPDEVIWTVAFNTTTWGHTPIGPTATCFATVQGCPYDSLNVGVESFEGQPSAGEDTDENAAILDSDSAASYCDAGARDVGRLRLDDDATDTCWQGFRPLATIRTSGNPGPKGDSE